MAARDLRSRLTSVDSSFLYVEKPKAPMHIGSIYVYEGKIRREELEQLLLDRLSSVPRYRQKVVFPPFGVAHPSWHDDPDFDISNHVEEITLKPPADDRALAMAAARVYAGMLDRRHPLWKLIIILGHESGNTAVVWKVHHAMVDGVSGVDLTMALHDLKADDPPPEPAEPWQARPLPDAVEAFQSAVRDRLTELTNAWTDNAFRLMRPSDAAARARTLTSALRTSVPQFLQPAPRTPWNNPVSGELDYAWAELDFTTARKIRSELGGTVNDLVLATLAGALGKYLRRHGRRTEGVQLRAMCPVSMRPQDARGALGNLVSVIVAPLFVGIEDPVERLHAERVAMDRLKGEKQAEGFYAMTDLTAQVPPAWQAAAGMLAGSQTLFNTVSTNVPGPQIPLFMAGRRLLHWYPMGVISSNIGLFVAILSYNGKLTMGTTVDARQVKDVPFLSECLHESFGELEAAARVAQAPHAPAEERRQPADKPRAAASA